MATSTQTGNAITVTAAEPREGYRLWLRFSDGAAGEVDLSHLAGDGVFHVWDDPACFASARITPYNSIAWTDDADLCADALYLQLTGASLEDLMPHRRPLGS